MALDWLYGPRWTKVAARAVELLFAVGAVVPSPGLRAVLPLFATEPVQRRSLGTKRPDGAGLPLVARVETETPRGAGRWTVGSERQLGCEQRSGGRSGTHHGAGSQSPPGHV